MTVSFGTVASAYAYRSFAPLRMMPPCSCAVPGKNPGTSTNVTSGMLNASQNRTKRAAFTDASMSSTPARTIGCCATTPTLRPSRCAKAQMMLRAQPSWTSSISPSSNTRRIASFMSYGLLAASGTSASSPESWRSDGSSVGTSGAGSRLFDGR